MFVKASEPAELVLEGLNEEQRTAVTHEGGSLLALAGAGTGKTTTLVARLVWLVESGVPPETILLLTFTRRAAREMLGRARTLIGPQAAGQVVGGTFHSVAYGVISAHAAALGLPPRVRVLDASDAADLLDLLREELGFVSGTHRFPQKGTLLDIYSRCVNAQQALTQVLAERSRGAKRTATACATSSARMRSGSESSAASTWTTSSCTGRRSPGTT